MGLLQFLTTSLLLLATGLPLVASSPVAQGNNNFQVQRPGKSVNAATFWLESISHSKGQSPFRTDHDSYPIFRNVKNYGAKGDGVTDDTNAIMSAMTAGGRCGQGCDSSTTAPAIVYFPPGTYIVSTPIILYYYTQLVGSATNRPVLKASRNFQGIAVLDSNPYLPGGANWYTNQNNFFKAVRNFVIDLTGAAAPATGIHWQVAQATSLQNIYFDLGVGSQHQGIFMENGSGGWLTDLVFNGGKIGMTIGNQQFTTRNLIFYGCTTGVNMLWDWAWTFKTAQFWNCGTAIDLTNLGQPQQGAVMVGSAILLDCILINTPVGVKLARTKTSSPSSAGSVILDNLYYDNVAQIVTSPDGSISLAGGSGKNTIVSWGSGVEYTTSSSSNTFSRTVFNAVPNYVPSKPAALRRAADSPVIFEKSRPQYEDLSVSSFVSAKVNGGCVGDGKADDYQCLQKLINSNVGKVIYLDHGVYFIGSTLVIPPGTKITGEAWSVIVGGGNLWKDENKPQPVIQVGKKGDKGCVEMSDLVISTYGYAPGAIGVEWNLGQGSQGCSGMWDVHIRIGGAAGTNQQSNFCTKTPATSANRGNIPENCITAFMLMHITDGGSVYMENNWIWTSDHDLDMPDHNQISLYSGRGLLIEGQGPVWLYGTAVEHNQLYNYQFSNAANIFAGMIQTETPYMTPNPYSTAIFAPRGQWGDPTFKDCGNGEINCYMAWGVRIVNSRDVIIYGAGLYSFFSNYAQECIKPRTCQKSMVSLEGNNKNVVVYNLNTIGTTNMLLSNGNVGGGVSFSPNPSVFGDVVAMVAKGN